MADRRLEILSGREAMMAERVKDLRAQLLDAHAQMIRRDDETRKTYGDAICLRNALLIERDTLIGQRDALIQGRTALIQERAALIQERAELIQERTELIGERDALGRALRHAESRLNLVRKSPLGLAFRAIRWVMPR
jgi:uncharacterized protein (DUF3084 family)